MKILLVTDFESARLDIEAVLSNAAVEADIIAVTTVHELLNAITDSGIDFIITEYAFDTLDVWRLANFNQTGKLVAKPIPMLLIKESCIMDVPLLWANAYGLKVVALSEIPSALQVPFQLSKPTLLIIEDDYHAANSASLALSDKFEVSIAYDGDSGFSSWQAHRQNVVLLDLMLPDSAGDYVLERVMSLDETQQVIAVSAYSTIEHHKKMILKGACHFLCKPYLIEDLRKQCDLALFRSALACQSAFHQAILSEISDWAFLINYHLKNNNINACRAIVDELMDLLTNTLPSEDKQEVLLMG